MLEHNFNDVQNNILGTLNQILLLVYGTETYHQILSAIKRSVKDIEQQHANIKYWQ